MFNFNNFFFHQNQKKLFVLNVSYSVLEYIHHRLEQWSTWGKRTPGRVCKIETKKHIYHDKH
jgi:hypothetical protein